MKRLLDRIGLDAAPAPDLEGLRRVHRAYVGTVPYEDLAVQLGECERLDPARLVERVAGDRRGGYCFELNAVWGCCSSASASPSPATRPWSAARGRRTT